MIHASVKSCVIAETREEYEVGGVEGIGYCICRCTLETQRWNVGGKRTLFASLFGKVRQALYICYMHAPRGEEQSITVKLKYYSLHGGCRSKQQQGLPRKSIIIFRLA